MIQVFCNLALSAVLYGICFWTPALWWWGSVISMILIMQFPILSAQKMLLYGFLWALCVYSMHLYGVVIGVVDLAAYRTWYAWLPGIILVFYLAVCTGIIWAVGAWCERVVINRLFYSPCIHSVWWGIWLWLYWLWMTYACLWPLGRCEGYLLANPIVPWASYPSLLWVVSRFGVMGATLFVCMLSACIAYISIHKKNAALLCGLSLFFMSMTFNYRVYKIPSVQSDDMYYQQVVSVTKPILASVNQAATCCLVRDYVEQAVSTCPGAVSGVVFPESCFYAWSLCAESILAEYLPLCHENCDYIIGSFYDDHGKYRNSCYWLRNGVLQKRFDKRHTMPLIERLPWWLYSIEFSQLFFSTMPEIIPSTNQRPIMQLGNTLCVPYICSELFFNRLPDDIYITLPIVALVNDRWAKPYLQLLMYLGAVIQAYAWNREILYVSYARFNNIKP